MGEHRGMVLYKSEILEKAKVKRDKCSRRNLKICGDFYTNSNILSEFRQSHSELDDTMSLACKVLRAYVYSQIMPIIVQTHTSGYVRTITFHIYM